MIKINNETKKTIIRIMIIKDLMQKLKTIEKKKTYYRLNVCLTMI
jgi:hypothetical protein